MSRRHLLVLVRAIVIAAATVPASHAEEALIRIAAGPTGGTYHDVYATNLITLLSGYTVALMETAGSVENANLLADRAAELGFAQTDVLADLIVGDPARYGELEVVGRIGDECLYAAVRKDGPVSSLADLGRPIGDRPARVAVGPDESGSFGTWRYVAHLMPSLGRAEVHRDTGTLALSRLGVGGFDLVAWVTDPENLDHVMLRAVLADDEVDLLSVDDAALTGRLPNGIEVYDSRKVRVAKGWFGRKVRTICTTGLIVARPGIDPRLLEQVSAVLTLETDRLRGQAP